VGVNAWLQQVSILYPGEAAKHEDLASCKRLHTIYRGHPGGKSMADEVMEALIFELLEWWQNATGATKK
jgi:hypothetical protein